MQTAADNFQSKSLNFEIAQTKQHGQNQNGGNWEAEHEDDKLIIEKIVSKRSKKDTKMLMIVTI